MRDLYNRTEKLAYWLKRIETDLQGSDKEDVLCLVRFMQDHERSSLWIIRCITILILVRKQLPEVYNYLDIIQLLKFCNFIFFCANHVKVSYQTPSISVVIFSVWYR
jgi:hypothetical protein